MTLNQKISILKRRLRELESAVIAFSGGVDSAILTLLAHQELKDKMCAATAISPSTPHQDKIAAHKFCQDHGIEQILCYPDEFDNPQYVANPKNRCYFCKSSLYKSLKIAADDKNYRYIVEGTNLSDLEGHRPGYKASCEATNVVTPLVDCGLTKEDVRQLARKFNIPQADKPASACLASRIPTGVKIKPEILKMIDEAEQTIRSFGLSQVRVRHHDDLARIEVNPDDITQLLNHREQICNCLKKLGYKFVSLDLRGYQTGCKFK